MSVLSSVRTQVLSKFSSLHQQANRFMSAFTGLFLSCLSAFASEFYPSFPRL